MGEGVTPSSIQAVTKTIDIKVVVNPKVQSSLCTLQLTVSPVVGNKASKTASAVTTVWEQCKQRDHPSLPSRAQHHLPVPPPFHAVPELCLTSFFFCFFLVMFNVVVVVVVVGVFGGWGGGRALGIGDESPATCSFNSFVEQRHRDSPVSQLVRNN